MWHLTCDTWRVTLKGGIWTFSQNLGFLALADSVLKIFLQRITDSINYKGNRRTAQAIPSLWITKEASIEGLAILLVANPLSSSWIVMTLWQSSPRALLCQSPVQKQQCTAGLILLWVAVLSFIHPNGNMCSHAVLLISDISLNTS